MMMPGGKEGSKIIEISHWKIRKLDDEIQRSIARSSLLNEQINQVEDRIAQESSKKNPDENALRDLQEQWGMLDAELNKIDDRMDTLLTQLQEFPEDVQREALASRPQKRNIDIKRKE